MRMRATRVRGCAMRVIPMRRSLFNRLHLYASNRLHLYASDRLHLYASCMYVNGDVCARVWVSATLCECDDSYLAPKRHAAPWIFHQLLLTCALAMTHTDSKARNTLVLPAASSSHKGD